MYVHLCLFLALLGSGGRAEKGGCQTNNDCHEYEMCLPEEGEHGECGDLWVNCQSQDKCAQGETCEIRNHDVVCLPNQTECRKHKECPDSMLCISQGCKDPCEGMECGVNSNCVTSNHINTACQCKPGFHKVDPSNETAGCTECSAHSHCPGNNMCVLEKCIDLCEHNVCGDNSTCNIDNNKLSCNATASSAKEQRPRVWSAEQSVNIGGKDGAEWDGGWVGEARFSVETRDLEVELTRLKCGVRAYVSDFTVRLRVHITSQFDTITVTHSALYILGDWDIPVSTRDKRVVLRPLTHYNITLSCDRDFYLLTLPSPRYTEPHFHLQLPPHSSGRYGSPVNDIYYKTLTFS